MPLKNSNAVAVERRTDLASLFCMIGRHGPAVVLAAVALVSVLAAFIIYRAVRGKRRKAAAAEGRGASTGRPEHEPNPEDAFGHADSTDVSDEGSSDVKEEASLIQSHPKVRRRRAAAANEKTPPPCSPAHGGHQVFKEDKNSVEVTDKEVPEKEDRREVEPAVNSPVAFGQTSCMSRNIDEASQDTEAETNGAEPELENRVTRRSKDQKQRLHLHNGGVERNRDEDEAMAAVRCGGDELKESDASRLLGSDSQAKVSGTAHLKERRVEDEMPPPLAKDARLNIPRPDLTSPEEQTQPGPVAALAEKPQHQQNGSVTNNGHFAATPPVPCGCDVKPDQDQVTVCQDQQSGIMGTDEGFKTRVHSGSDACGDVSVGAPEGTAHPPASSCPDQPSDVTSPIDPVWAGAVHPSICKINPLSFEQSDPTEEDRDGAASPGVGPESGISSMAVSPDVQVAGTESELAVSAEAFPASQPEEGTRNGLFADAAASFIVNDHHQSVHSQKPLGKSTDRAEHESAAANEDVFGHEVDDRYQSALDQYMAQITASVTSEAIKKTDMKDAEGVEIRGGCGESVKKKEVKKENEESEKTEISIMEATMDNNEWITDSNYQVPPWMNVCTSPFAQGDQKPSHVPPGAGERSAPPRDAEDTPASAEVRPKQPLRPGEENPDNGKKVVAVQPMPQNVSVTFRTHYLAHSPYQTVAVTGNQQELGNWKEFVPLERAKDGHWAAVVSLPAESRVEWKFVLLDKGEVCRWEECGNRLLDTGCGEDVKVHEWWGLL